MSKSPVWTVKTLSESHGLPEGGGGAGDSHWLVHKASSQHVAIKVVTEPTPDLDNL